MDKISIIIPVYNVEKYIVECLESIVNQTYNNLEIILIDDASPDRCPEICDHYALRDNRVIVIHQNNMGLSGARNSGLKIATGDYILFWDSDDYLALDYCEKMLQATQCHHADITVGEIITVDETGKEINDDNGLHFKQSRIVNNYEAMQMLICQKEMKGFACGKLYKKEIVEGIVFPIGKVYEDRFTVPKYFHKAKTVYLCKGAYAYYRIRNSSISHMVSGEKFEDLLEAERWMIQYCEENYPDLAGQMKSVYFGRYIHLWILLYDAGKNEEAKKLVDEMKIVYRNYARQSEIRKVHKLSYKMIFIVPKLYRYLIHKLQKDI